MIEDTMVDPSLQILQQLLVAATRDASAAMCQWTNGSISLTLDEVREIPLEDAGGVCNIGGELLTMVVLNLEGEQGGQLILAFDEENGRKLAASLLGRQVCTEPEWTNLEMSALNETGNILGCAYMNALTRLIDMELVPSPPYFMQDFGASVLQQAVMAQAMVSDKVLVCSTKFQCDGEKLDWNVFFVPSQELRKTMEDSIQNAC